MTVVIGLMPQPFVSFTTTAAQQLLEPEAYIRTVLGDATGGAP